jgi:hypothetical protein
MELLAAAMSGCFALLGVYLGGRQGKQERISRAQERAEQRRQDDLARLILVYENILKLCLDVRATVFAEKGKASAVDASTFRAARAQLMLHSPKALDEAFQRVIERTGDIASRDPNDFFDVEAQCLVIDWKPVEDAMNELREMMFSDLERRRQEVPVASQIAAASAHRMLTKQR